MGEEIEIEYQEMEIDSDEEDDALAAIVILGGAYLLEKRKKNLKHKRKPRSVWVREWAEKRNSEGVYAKLLMELRTGDSGEQRLYRNFLRMEENRFNHLLSKVGPLIEKNDTKFRQSISAGERLALTLHYLATGNSFRSLQYTFRIPQPTISIIIPEVLDAIWTVLKNDYIKVIFRIYIC